MNSEIITCIRIPVFPIGILKYRHHKNEVFAFISVRYTITDLQTRESF